MKQRIKERTSVSGRENEAIPVRPQGIARIEFEQAIPERVCHGRLTQGQPKMARVCLLHHVYREEAEGVDAQLI
jgi:hypothetical protein